MLSNLIKVHQAKQSARKERQEKKKREAIIAASALTHSLVDHLNAGYRQYTKKPKIIEVEPTDFWDHCSTPQGDGVKYMGYTFILDHVKVVMNSIEDINRTSVANAYVNQKKLDTETKILQSNAAQFSKQTTQWLKLVEDFNTALKEIGDVENWAKSIETDMRTISTALEYTYKRNET